MMQQAHADRTHALLSPSKASRWINCPPSAREEEKIPDKRTHHSEEGEKAHELAENKLRRRLLPCNSETRKDLDEKLREIHESPYYGEEMEELITEYAALIEEKFMEAKKRSSDALLILENRLFYTEWVPEGFGSCDVVIVSDGVIEVVDLKYGKGVAVNAYNNLQLRLYGLAAWSNWGASYLVDEIRMTIVQPRRDGASTDVISIDDLLEWAERVVKPAAELAYAGEGEFKAGDHCKWCKIRGSCRARGEENLKQLAHEFRDPATYSADEMGTLLPIAKQLKAWAADVDDAAFERAKAGECITGYKLIAGKSNRFITDEEAAKVALSNAGVPSEKYLKPQELYGIGKLEQKVGKKEIAYILDGLIVKPPGKPALVPETDRRPALNSVEADFGDMDDDR